MQMRGDWVNTPQGTRVRRDTATFEHFAVARVRRLDEWVVRADGEDLVVEFRKPAVHPDVRSRVRAALRGLLPKTWNDLNAF